MIFVSFLQYAQNIAVVGSYYFLILLLNLLSYAYLIAKMFRFFCYARLTLDWFPMINPYLWPTSFIEYFTGPYFRFFEDVIPPIKFQKGSFDISIIVALEVINSLLSSFVRLVNIIFLSIQSTEILKTLLETKG